MVIVKVGRVDKFWISLYGLWDDGNSYIPYLLYGRRATKGKASGEGDHLTPNIVHVFLYVHGSWLCNLNFIVHVMGPLVQVIELEIWSLAG